MKLRIGHGYDAHRFGEGRFVTLGGVRIPHEKGLQAHSDGDVILHALCDALLGAMALGDIGKHFPDTDIRYKNADSIAFLRQVYSLVNGHGFILQNADITVLAQQPRIAPYVDVMRETIAQAISVDPANIGVKATTTEKMGFVGREEGISAHAVVLLAADF